LQGDGDGLGDWNGRGEAAQVRLAGSGGTAIWPSNFLPEHCRWPEQLTTPQVWAGDCSPGLAGRQRRHRCRAVHVPPPAPHGTHAVDAASVLFPGGDRGPGLAAGQRRHYGLAEIVPVAAPASQAARAVEAAGVHPPSGDGSPGPAGGQGRNHCFAILVVAPAQQLARCACRTRPLVAGGQGRPPSPEVYFGWRSDIGRCLSDTRAELPVLAVSLRDASVMMVERLQDLDSPSHAGLGWFRAPSPSRKVGSR
jgi:hypothetical protein